MGEQTVTESRERAILAALLDARDALTERGDTCTARAANAPGGENACPAVPCACDLEGKADGLAGGALAINAIITRFWGEEAVL